MQHRATNLHFRDPREVTPSQARVTVTNTGARLFSARPPKRRGSTPQNTMSKERRFFDPAQTMCHPTEMPGPAHYEPVELNTKRRLLKIGCYKIKKSELGKEQHFQYVGSTKVLQPGWMNGKDRQAHERELLALHRARNGHQPRLSTNGILVH